MNKLVRTIGILGLSLIGACSNIGPSEVGVRIDKCSGGGVESTPVPTGWTWVSPFCQDLIEFPIKVNNFTMAQSVHEGDIADTSIHVQSKENMDLSVDLTISYRIDPTQAPKFYKKWKIDGDSLHQFENNFIRNLTREILREAVVKYSAEDVYGKQNEIHSSVQAILTKRLNEEGLVVENFSINQIRVPERIKAAIETKVAAIQEAQAAENKVRQIKAQAAQSVAEAEGRAASAIASADGEAKARKLKADGEAYYVTTVQRALTKEYVDYVRAQRWDGNLPHVVSGAGSNMMLQLKE